VLSTTQDTTFLTQAAQNDVQAGSLGALAFNTSTSSQVQFLGGMAFLQSAEGLTQLLPLLRADGVSLLPLITQEIPQVAALAGQSGSVFDQQFLSAMGQSGFQAVQQTQTEVNSGTDGQLTALASARLAELRLILALTAAVGTFEFPPGAFLGNGLSVSSSTTSGPGSSGNTVVVSTSTGVHATTSTNGFDVLNNGGLPIGTSSPGFNTINNGGFGIGSSAAFGINTTTGAF
jgi:hypothetical protein